MFIACPHCRYLVATAPRDPQAPGHCPRCGGALGDASPRGDRQPPAPALDADAGDGGPSLARLLRRDERVAEPVPAATEETEADTTGSTSMEPAKLEQPDAPIREASPPEDIAVEAETAPSTSEPLTEAPVDPTPAETPTPIAPSATAPARHAARAPSFLRGQMRAQAASARTPRWQWATLGALAIALVLQVLLADRARLAGDAGWRPALATLCNVLGCSLPPWREPQAFAMLDRDVRPVPGAPGVLLAQATFRNEARWAQPWPVLMLTLKDADGRTLGARALRPAEYLPRDSAASATISPGQSAQVAIRVREPSANVVAFSFDFR